MIQRPVKHTGAKEKPLLRINTSNKRPVDKSLFTVFVMLLLTGLVVLYAASFYNAQDSGGNPLSEVISHFWN